MVKIGSRIRKLLRESKTRKDKVDDILVSTLEVLDTTNKSMEKIGDAFETMEVTILSLAMDYAELKERMDNMKNNFWMRLFGIK